MILQGFCRELFLGWGKALFLLVLWEGKRNRRGARDCGGFAEEAKTNAMYAMLKRDVRNGLSAKG